MPPLILKVTEKDQFFTTTDAGVFISTGKHVSLCICI
jgi:hypothetical protein